MFNLKKLKDLKEPSFIAQYLIEALRKEGEFVKCDNSIYYLDSSFNLATLSELPKIIMFGGYIPNQKMMSDVFYQITSQITYALSKDLRVINIKELSYFDKEKEIFYMTNFDNEVYKVTKNKIDLIDNDSSCGIYFKKNTFIKNTPKFKYVVDPNFKVEESAFDKYLNCTGIEKVILWFSLLSLLLRDLIDPTPILIFVGQSSSGKSTAARILGKLIYGEGFSMSPIPSSRKDFLLFVNDSVLLGIDNIEKAPDWFNDAACVACSSNTHKERKLYSDKESVEYQLGSMLMLTSVHLPVHSPEILNRSLVINFNKGDHFINSSVIFDELDSQRDLLLSKLLEMVMKFIQNIKTFRNHTTSSRLSGFLSICSSINKERGSRLEKEILSLQHSTALSKSQLMTLFSTLIEESGVICGTVHDIFYNIPELEGIYGSFQKFNSAFQKELKSIEYYFNLVTVRKNKKTLHSISKKENSND